MAVTVHLESWFYKKKKLQNEEDEILKKNLKFFSIFSIAYLSISHPCKAILKMIDRLLSMARKKPNFENSLVSIGKHYGP